MGKILEWDDIVQINDCEEIPVNVPAWGGDVIIRPLTVQEIDEARQGKDATIVNKTMLRLSLVKPSLTPEQIDTLWVTKRGSLVANLLTEIAKANGMGTKNEEGDKKDKEAVFPGEGTKQ